MKKDYIFVAQVLKQPEQKEVRIEIPEGYEIDRENSTFEKIVFKPIDTKPRNWEEYCRNFRGEFYYIKDNENNIGNSSVYTSTGLTPIYRNTLPSKELAEAFLAMMQLMSLRQAWIGDWEPDWKDYKIVKWNIIYLKDRLCISSSSATSHPLSFPTQEMAEDFMNCFKDLLKIAEPLI